MLTNVGTVCIFVSDQDRAKKFYMETLGLELRRDEPLFPGAPNRWLAVAPPGAVTEIVLYKLDQNWQHFANTIGKSQPSTFAVTDLVQMYHDLKAKGVQFTNEPDVQPWGTFVTLLDPDGNGLLLVEQPKHG
jgi:catechol 2,3-dioxygenase-like lactoylglutathione lyase family enzyme